MVALLVVCALSDIVACGGPRLPHPRFAQVHVDDYVEVPFPPRPPPVEIVPAPPRGDAVWADGTWEWSGERYRWQPGGWVVPPPGARYVRWVVVRRGADGQLFFAPSYWQDADGAPIEAPAALTRARSRATDDD